MDWIARFFIGLFFSLLVASCGGGGSGSGEESSSGTSEGVFSISVQEREIWKYTTSEQLPSYTYAGETYPGGPVSFFIQGHASVDIWKDGNRDIIIPINKGYASGIDTRIKPLLFKNTGTHFIEASSDVVNAMPSIPGLRRISVFEDSAGLSGLFGVAHDTGDNNSADALLLIAGPSPSNDTNLRLPALPLSTTLARNNAVDAHSMAGGDINGDGLTDFVVGEWRDIGGPYKLMQTTPGNWEVENDPLISSLLNFPMTNPSAGEGFNLLLDLHLADVNGDGFDDLISGFGHGSANSQVYLNDGSGSFSNDQKRSLPSSVYGIDNSLHLKTYSIDKDKDGDIDLLIVYSRFEPYYAGYSFQLLINDGTGNFSDQSDAAFTYASSEHVFAERLEWSDNFYLMDVNNDGEIDIIGADSSGIRLWLGSPGISWEETPVMDSEDVGGGAPVFVKMGDGSVHGLVFSGTWTDSIGSSVKIWIDHIKLNR